MTTDRSTFPDPMEIHSHLDQQVRGQDHAKRYLSVAIYNHFISHHLEANFRNSPQHLLLLGPEGVGKTFLVQKVAEWLGVPWIHADASSLVQSAIAGEALQRITGALIQRAGGDFAQAQKGIVLIDQLDQCRRTMAGPGDPGMAVQDAILALMDGIVMRHPQAPGQSLDTAGLLFICCGSFPELREVIVDRIGDDERIGFQSEDEDDPDDDTPQIILNDLIARQDLVSLGLGEELAARFGHISLLDSLTEKDFVYILDQMETSIIGEKKKFWAAHGIELSFNEEAMQSIASLAMASEEGARGLHGIVERVLDPIDHRPVELARAGIRSIEIDRSCVEDGTEPPMKSGKGDDLVDQMLAEVWSKLQPQSSESAVLPIAIDAAILSIPVAGLTEAIRQLEMALGRLGLTTEQDRTWRSLIKKYPGEGQRVILQLLATIQQAGSSLPALCGQLEKNNGDLVETIGSILNSKR
ncbi:MAG: AAA domain-containing protein [Planctomycetes bacterium]|jgi:ATP-dependent Clp protease ATP-binding subunit ClpX|nr:AAA domain-containing protein [Planctomycetota bacterium]MBT6451672.1 AAA domain-containing protein [Planctomycetota bacterium]MBT6542187.1 AAA domain-containing protein [Planctomycetota bacterium]MBT6784697.1 AAA domain-containing protein [Planctomycetota bacterium]MBT6969260.1 AAA domain-containing protein [Planctomycetota bacterium]